MKAGFLTDIRKIEIREINKPEIQSDNEVLLKIKSVGVCGSDIHYYKDGKIGTQRVNFPFRICHEFSAVVEETGKKVKKIKIGDQVAVDPATFCRTCDQCKEGRFNTCRTLLFMGSPGLKDGCLCEYTVVPETSCYPSKKLSFDQLCLVEPMSIAVYAVKYPLTLKKKNIGILGAGPIGLCTLIAALDKDAGKIYVTDKIDSRCETAFKHGAYWTANPLNTDIVKEIEKKEPLLLDYVFECCGDQDAIDQAMMLLKPGGKLIIVGIHESERISISTDLMRRREITIYNVRRQNESTYDALKLIESGKFKVDFMVTHHFNIEESQKAFDTVANYKDNVIKAIINV
ncbi:MAG: alcohol dehydrogenase catalytic domain-containing protein [Spirochaetes bacterium]|nr:alcohol dehydrogenase catalytic domain-containing protein [Spirochaetota bacterium]